MGKRENEAGREGREGDKKSRQYVVIEYQVHVYMYEMCTL